MWYILLRLLHVVNAWFSYDLSGCLLIRLTPVSQGVALGRCPVDVMNNSLKGNLKSTINFNLLLNP
ncbi:hypothetical protein [Shigella phage ESh9]|nr:hypothetical protein [Shigella phage ESh9]